MPRIRPLAIMSSQLLKVNEDAIPLSDTLSLRIYSDTRPHNLKIANLQKGLILAFEGIETIGEGTGFGVPVLKYHEETYFSGSSRLYVSQHRNSWIVRKEFLMNRIARDQLRNARLENQKVRALAEYMAGQYQEHKRMQFLTLALKRLLMLMGVNASFVKASPTGKVIVTYTIHRNRILVKADFTHSKKENLQKIFMLNEQGTRFFRRYVDSNGIRLVDNEIGAWEANEAEQISITDLRGKVGFRLKRGKNSVLRSGREFMENSLDWVGLDYEIKPEVNVFEYEVEILGV